MAYLARVSYTGNGSTADYALPFTYIASSHIYAWLDNVATTAFTISGSTLTFTTAPSNSVAILIKRVTPTDARLVDFTDGSVLTESDLDQSADQNFYIAQESSDTAQTHLALNNSSLWDADSKRIINVATPTSGTDAANKTYIDTQTTSAATSATAAATSATAAATSATAAATAETNAETAETNAETAETNAETAETNAETAETNATTQASNASTSATSAATSATTATTQASAASTSATAAAGSATTATTQASNASTSATNAATSATSAATSATAAAASLDSFDDVYLGAKGSAPTLDNDGDALTQGDLYYNTSGNTLNYYTGSTWVVVTSGGITSVAADSTPELGGDLGLNGNNIDFPTTANISDCLDEDTMSSDSATKLATQQSIKAYVDSKSHLSLIDEDDMSTDSATRPPSQQSVKAYVDDAGGGTSWQSVETGATFTAVAGNGYPVNTTAQACTVTLPAGSVGDTIELVDYAGTWDTNNVTLTADGSEKIKGSTDDVILDVERQGIKIVYVDATQGWVAATGVNDDTAPAINPPSYDIDFLVVAGGGSGGSQGNGGGGGAGGYRTSTQTANLGTEITITVGDGGAGTSNDQGTTGSASSFSGSGVTTISSAGGGGGGGNAAGGGLDGGSGGGGGSAPNAGGSGNTPSTSPVQGYDGGDGHYGSPGYGGGGGGGASEAGEDGSSVGGEDGGDGIASSISGSSVTRAGGGGGGTNSATVGSGGAGGGGNAAGEGGGDGSAGTVNTGGGGGACEWVSTSGAGGKGVVVLSMPDAKYSTTVTGSPTVATGQGAGSDTTTLVFTGSGSYTT